MTTDITQARAERDKARGAYAAAQTALYDYRAKLLAGDTEYQRLYQLTREMEHRAGLATAAFVQALLSNTSPCKGGN